jgi:phosphoribosyl 1,2-cyclic phosphodiesterase
MEITCWGSRGSIPVSGKEYLKYGGDTTCIELRTKSGDAIIIDAGTGIRRLGNKLEKEQYPCLNFLFTHAHWDHLMGFPFFKPLYRENTHIRMHKCPFHSKFVETILSKVMTPPNFPVRYSDLKAKIDYEDACPDVFEIGSVKIIPIQISHPNSGSGYKFIEDGKSFVFITDNELGFMHPGGKSFQEYQAFSSDADLLLHDAEYTAEEYQQYKEWGHSTYTEVIDLALGSRVKKLGLFHLNQDRTDRQMDKIVKDCRKRISENGFLLECFAVASDMTFTL